MEKSKNYLEIEVEKGSGIMNYRTHEVQGFNCDIDFNCGCGWHGSAWGEFSKGTHSQTCPDCGAKNNYNI